MANDLNLSLVLRARAEQAKAELAAIKTELKGVGEAGREAGREGAQGGTEHARALEALRARFNPLFAASRAYEAELHDIAAAEKLGAISAREAALARERAAAAMAPLSAGFIRMGASANAARAHVTNLSFQLNDIAMMVAAGQNPLMTAAQQGGQVGQVFGQMREQGIAIGPALARSFSMFLNPLSLATMGVIAFGAAAVQWFLKADAAVVPLEEATERLAQSMGTLREATREALVPMRELREEWGAQAGAVRGLRGEQALLAQSQARLDLANQARALAAMRATGGVTNLPGAAGWQATLQEGGYDLLAREQRDLAAVLASVDWAGPPEALAESLRAANAEIGAIMARIQADGKTITEPFAALSKLLLDFEMNARTVVGSIAATAGDADRLAGALDRRGAAMKAAAKDWLGETLRGVEAERARQAELAAGNQALRERIAARQAEAAMAELVARYGAESHEVALARVAAERAAEQAIVDAAGGTEALKREAMEAWDALKGIATAAGQISFGAANAGAAELARKLGVSLGLAQQLAGLGLGEAALEEGDGRGSQREGRANARAFHREQWMAQNTARLAALRDKALGITPAGVDGASGAGGGAAEISAAARLLEAQREELALLRTLDPVQREVIKNREALAAAGVKEAAAIRENIVELVRLREVEAAVKEIGAAGRDAFVGLVTGTLSLKEALGQLIGKLAEMAASSAWDILWEGGKGGGGGLGGLLIDWLSGGIGKKPDAGKKADGGRVSGPGGPRQDNLLHWLSNGEYVVNAAATQRNLGLLEAINAGAPVGAALAAAARAPKLADGGLVGGAGFPAALVGRARPGVNGSDTVGAQKIELSLHLDSDLLRAEIRETATPIAISVTRTGLDEFSHAVLPGRQRQINANPRRLVG